MNEGTASYEHQPYPDYRQAYAGPQYARQPAPQTRPKHRIARHVWRNFFRYFFFAVQAIFLIWLITGLAGTSGSGASAHAQAIHDCSGTQWHYLYKSYNDCVTHLGNGYSAASDVGKGVAVGLIIALWVAADVILGIGRIVVLLGRRYQGAHR